MTHSNPASPAPLAVFYSLTARRTAVLHARRLRRCPYLVAGLEFDAWLFARVTAT